MHSFAELLNKLISLHEDTVRAVAVIRDDCRVALDVDLGTAVCLAVAGDLDLVLAVQALDRDAEPVSTSFVVGEEGQETAGSSGCAIVIADHLPPSGLPRARRCGNGE